MVALISRTSLFSQRLSARLCALLVPTVLICLRVPGRADTPQHAMPPTLDPTYGLPLPKHKMEAMKPVPDAQWIWADRTTDRQTVFLRAAVTLKRAPKTASIYVTADNFYTLYVNGHAIDKTEPDPKDDSVWHHVHRLDVVSHLVPGRNVIALRAYNEGSVAGALLRLEVDQKPILWTDASWKVSEDAALPDDWANLDYNDSAWRSATIIAPVTGGAWGSNLEGWPGLSETAAPYLAHLPIEAVAVLDRHPGTGPNDPPSVVLDFGKELTGRVEILAQEPMTVMVGTGESREEAIKMPWSGVHRLDPAKGRTAASPYSAFRYAKLTFVDARTADPFSQVTVTLDHLYYPVQYKGSFDCSDPLLTRIWYTGAYTAHLCMQEDIWDAPKRDRMRWMGDLHVSGEVINTVFADRFLMEQTMQRLRDDAQGGAPAGDPPKAHVNGIPGYSCAWIAGVADLYRHIGDRDYLNRQHDALITMLEYFRGELDDRGVFADKRGQWPFVDWAPEFNGNHPPALAATHLFLIKAVKEAVFLFHEMGDETNAAKYAAWGDELTAAAQKYLPDATTGTFGDRRQENAMAIYSGVATPAQTQAIYDTILKPGSAAWDWVATPYYNNYVIYAMSLAGHTTETLDVLRRYWGGMLAEGATSWWEGYDPKWEKRDFHAHLQADDGTGYFVSLSHGWSSGPTSWLTERVLGVRPTSGGFKTCEIAPDLGDLSWVEGSVPAPKGLIHVRAERHGDVTTLHVTLPQGVEARVGVLDRSVQVNGRTVSPDSTDNGRAYVRLHSAGRYTIVGR